MSSCLPYYADLGLVPEFCFGRSGGKEGCLYKLGARREGPCGKEGERDNVLLYNADLGLRGGILSFG